MRRKQSRYLTFSWPHRSSQNPRQPIAAPVGAWERLVFLSYASYVSSAPHLRTTDISAPPKKQPLRPNRSRARDPTAPGSHPYRCCLPALAGFWRDPSHGFQRGPGPAAGARSKSFRPTLPPPRPLRQPFLFAPGVRYKLSGKWLWCMSDINCLVIGWIFGGMRAGSFRARNVNSYLSGLLSCYRGGEVEVRCPVGGHGRFKSVSSQG